MKYKKIIPILFLVMLVVTTLQIHYVYATDTLLDSNPDSGYSTLSNLKENTWSSGGDDSATGQSFTTPNNGNSYKLTSCKFYLEKSGSPTGTAYAYLYAHTGTYGSGGGPTGSPLATSDGYSVSSLTTSFAEITLTFSGAQQYTMSPNTHYCIVWANPTSGISSTNYVITGVSTNVHSGNWILYELSAWRTNIGTYDQIFYVYGQLPDNSPTPSAISSSETRSGYSCNFLTTWTDDNGLSFYIFGTNNTGHWVNDTTTAFSSNPQSLSITKTLNTTVGNIIQWEYWANDSINQWANTGIQSLTITGTWNLIEIWNGNVIGKDTYVIETWNGNLDPKSFSLIEAWDGEISTRAPNSVETWLGNLNTSRWHSGIDYGLSATDTYLANDEAYGFSAYASDSPLPYVNNFWSMVYPANNQINVGPNGGMMEGYLTRWDNIPLDNSSQITSANMTFVGGWGGAGTVRIYYEMYDPYGFRNMAFTGDPDIMSARMFDLSNYISIDMSSGGTWGTHTIDVTSIIQFCINSPDWHVGDSIVFLVNSHDVSANLLGEGIALYGEHWHLDIAHIGIYVSDSPESWFANIITQAPWFIETWGGTMTTKNFFNVGTWNGKLIPKIFNVVGSWFGKLTSSAWRNIMTWNGKLWTIGWRLGESWYSLAGNNWAMSYTWMKFAGMGGLFLLFASIVMFGFVLRGHSEEELSVTTWNWRNNKVRSKALFFFTIILFLLALLLLYIFSTFAFNTWI